jgi:hypothetical protein
MRKPPRPGTPVTDGDIDAFSIRDFCQRHGISEAFYFKLKAQGLTPQEMRLGSRVLISRESAARWRAEREQQQTDAA